MLEVVKSTCGVTWHLRCNGIIINTGVKQELIDEMNAFSRKYGLRTK